MGGRRSAPGKGWRVIILSNAVAIGFALTLASLLAVDALMGWGGALFLARRFVELLESLAVWR